MELQKLPYQLSVCKVSDLGNIGDFGELVFVGKTDEELSLVCETAFAPADALEREDGWRAFRICGVLDFSLIGILSKIATALADAGIGIFAVSTFNTDYILVKQESFTEAEAALAAAGYTIV